MTLDNLTKYNTTCRIKKGKFWFYDDEKLMSNIKKL